MVMVERVLIKIFKERKDQKMVNTFGGSSKSELNNLN